jgi:hypothetical protein
MESGDELAGAVADNVLIKDWQTHLDTFADKHGCDKPAVNVLLKQLRYERNKFNNHSSGKASKMQHTSGVGWTSTRHRFSEYRLTPHDIDLLDAYVSACQEFTMYAVIGANGTPSYPSSKIWPNPAAVRPITPPPLPA